MSKNRNPLIEINNLVKKFGAFTALNGVSLDVYPGEVHALLGDNGAGKSTLIKVLSGVHPATGGEIKVDGEIVHFTSPRQASDAGIGTVYQDLALCDNLTAASNIFLTREITKNIGFMSILNFSKMFQRAKDIFEELKSLTLSNQPDISLNIQGKYTPVRLESNNSKQFDLWSVTNAPLDSLHTPIILKNIASTYKEREEENIYKENQEYIRLVQFQYTGSAKFGAKYLKEKLTELKEKLPLGYQFENSQNRWFLSDDKNNNYTFLLFLVLGIIYFICSILFESLKQPFIILSVIPISFIGVFLTFYLFDFNFDQGGLASFVLLSGITVNASIFIINGFNKLKKEFPKQNYINLYIEAFKQKIFPITLTIISTILGFIPFIKDGQNEVFWFALGAGTIGGLLFSLLGILIYLPLFTLKQKRLVE